MQQALRQEKEIAAIADKNRKLENELISRNEIYAKNDKCEEQLFHVTPEVETNNFEDLPIEAFHKVKPMDLLDAFIRVRFFKQSTAPKGQAKRIPKKKGTAEEAKNGKVNLISVAYGTRLSTYLLPRPELDDTGDVIMVTPDTPETNVPLPRLIVESAPPSPPSTFLSNPKWVRDAIQNIHSGYLFSLTHEDMSDDNFKCADKLELLLLGRFERHISFKIADKSKHTHWCLIFFRNNLNRFSALLVLFDHATSNPWRGGEDISLLKHPSQGKFVEVVNPNLEGSYLHYNLIDCAWIRSGKAVGSDQSEPRASMLNRNSGHIKRSKTSMVSDGNKMYRLYPSRSNPNKRPFQAHFEDLKQFVGLGFDRDRDFKNMSDSNLPENVLDTLFDWDGVLDKVDAMNEGTCTTRREKQLVILGYSFELAYDLCLSPSWNVSENPGFESRLHIFNNSQNEQ